MTKKNKKTNDNNNNNNNNNDNNNAVELNHDKKQRQELDSRITKDIISIIQQHPEYTFINSNDTLVVKKPADFLQNSFKNLLKTVKEFEQQINIRQIERNNIPNYFWKLFYFHRISLAESFIENVELLVAEVQENTNPHSNHKIDTQRDFLLTHRLTAISTIISCELFIEEYEKQIGSDLYAKLKSVSLDMKAALNKLYIISFKNFHHSVLLKQNAPEGVTIFQDFSNPFFSHTEASVIERLINIELLPMMNNNVRRKQIIVYLGGLPDDTIVMDVGYIDEQLILTIISLNNLSSYFSFISFLNRLLSKHKLKFQIVLSQGTEDYLETNRIPEKCLALCHHLQKIDLPRLILALTKNEISNDTQKIILSPLNTIYHLAFGKADIELNTVEEWSIIKEKICLNFNLFSNKALLVSIKDFLITSNIETDAQIFNLDKNAENIIEKNPDQYTTINKLLTTLKKNGPRQKDGFDRAYYDLKTFILVIENLRTNSIDELNLYFYAVCRLVKSFFACIDSIESTHHSQTTTDKDSNDISPVNMLVKLIHSSITVPKQEMLLYNLIDNIVRHVSFCEKLENSTAINPVTLKLFNELTRSIHSYLEKIIKITNPDYLSYTDIKQKISNQDLVDMKCFRYIEKNDAHFSFPSPTAVITFFTHYLLPQKQQEWQTTQFLVFPTLDPTNSFLLKISFSPAEQTLYLFFVSAFNHSSQVDFMCQLKNLLAEHNIPFKIFQYQQAWLKNQSILPELYFELAKFLMLVNTTYFFEILENDLLREKEKILFENEPAIASSIPDATLLNCNLFVRSELEPNFGWNFSVNMPTILRKALLSCNSMQLLSNTLLFVEGYHLDDIQKFKKVIALAKQYSRFDIYSKDVFNKSPLQIAFEKKYYAHAFILIEAGADIKYLDKNNKSVKDYFYVSLNSESLEILRGILPELVELFQSEIKIFEDNMSKNTLTNENIEKIKEDEKKDDSDEESLESTESASYSSSSDNEESQGNGIELLDREASNILSSDKEYYADITNIFNCSEKTDDKKNLTHFSRACEAVEILIRQLNKNKKTAKDNLFLYFYYIYSYTDLFFEHIAQLNCLLNKDEPANDNNNNNQDTQNTFEQTYQHTDKVIRFLKKFEKTQHAIEDEDLKYQMNLSIRALLENCIKFLPSKLTILYRLKSKEFMSYSDITDDINNQPNQSLSNIQCFKYEKTNKVLYLHAEFTFDFFYEKIKPLEEKGWPTTQFLIFPLQQPHICFLLHLSYVDKKLQLLFVAATHFNAHYVFMDELNDLLKNNLENQIEYTILKCQRNLKTDLFLLPQFMFNIAKSLKQADLPFLWTAINNNFLSSDEVKKITNKSFALKIAKKKGGHHSIRFIEISPEIMAFNPDFIIPKKITEHTLSLNDEQKKLMSKMTPEYLENVLLFKKGLISTLCTFEIIVILAKQYGKFDIYSTGNLKRSPLQIALYEHRYQHALILISYGADLSYKDTQGKSVAQYFHDTVAANKKLLKEARKEIPKQLFDKFPLASKKKKTKETQTNEILELHKEQYKEISSFIADTDKNSASIYENYRKILNFLETFKNTQVTPAENLHLYFYFTFKFLQKIIEDIDKQQDISEIDLEEAIKHTIKVENYTSKKPSEKKVIDLFDGFRATMLAKSTNKTHLIHTRFKEENLILEMQNTPRKLALPANPDKFKKFFISNLAQQKKEQKTAIDLTDPKYQEQLKELEANIKLLEAEETPTSNCNNLK